MNRSLIRIGVPILLAVPGFAQRVPTSTSFEDLPAGGFGVLETPLGRWLAEDSAAAIDDQHAKSGGQCLHLRGGESQRVTLDLNSELREVSELTFWAERWTRREPFEFRLEALGADGWAEVYRGDQEVVVGTFRTHVRVPIHRPIEGLRWTCTSPSGVLIDDLHLGRSAPMELVEARVIQDVLPCFVNRPRNPVAEVILETVGSLEPMTLTELRVSLTGTEDMEGVRAVEILDEEGVSFGASRAAGESLTFVGEAALHEGRNRFTIAVTTTAGANLDHRVDAGCVGLRLGEGELVVPTTPHPEGAQRMAYALRDGGEDGVAVYRIPGLVTTNSGALLAAYDVRWKGWGDLPGDIDVGLSRSLDGGRSWEEMSIVLDMGDDPAFGHDGVGDPSILVDEETGRVWIAAIWSHGDRGWNGSGPGLTPEETGQLLLIHSDDDGKTWSAPRNVTGEVKRPEWCFLLQGPGRGISMEDGTLVFPAQYQDTLERERMPHATLLTSRDHGETWQIGTSARSNTTEAQVVELEPGVLMLNMRDNRGGTRAVAVTRDLGRTWVEHPSTRSALVDPVCNAGLVKAGDSILLFSNPAVDRPPRKEMTLRASLDLGQTWPGPLRVLLDQHTSAGYSSLTMIDDRTVGVLYEGSRAQLTFQRVSLAQLLSAQR